MLITRRKVGEALVIGDRIEVHVLEISQGRVKLGVSAPSELRVERREWRILESENRSATEAVQSTFVQDLLRSSLRMKSGPTELEEQIPRPWTPGFPAPEQV